MIWTIFEIAICCLAISGWGVARHWQREYRKMHFQEYVARKMYDHTLRWLESAEDAIAYHVRENEKLEQKLAKERCKRRNLTICDELDWGTVILVAKLRADRAEGNWAEYLRREGEIRKRATL